MSTTQGILHYPQFPNNRPLNEPNKPLPSKQPIVSPKNEPNFQLICLDLASLFHEKRDSLEFVVFSLNALKHAKTI